MIKLIFKIFVFIRDKLNPLKLPTDKAKWNEVRVKKMSEYSEWINSFEYLSDPLFGLLDKTETFEHFIDPNTTSGRDCDDWAMMWDLWGIFNGRESITVVVTNPKHPFKTAHVVTVLYNPRTKKYNLCNYTPTKIGNTFEEALDGVRQWNTYKEDYIYAIQCKRDPLTKDEIKFWEEG